MGGTGRDVKRRIVYDPLPSQRKFHRSKARFKGFSGPIGSGKSQALCQEAIRLSYVNKGRMGLLGAPTYPMLRDATQATLLEILNEAQIPYDLNRGENTLLFRDTGSRILFRPVDDFERLRGTNLAWFGLDELTYTHEEAWLRLQGRLRDPKASRHCGFAVWTPKGYDWVYRKFIAEVAEGYEAVIAAPFENRHLLAKTPDFYKQLESSYDERFFQQEVMGSYLNMNGTLVYSSFSRPDHVRDLKLRAGYPLMWALDFNVDPMTSIVAQEIGGKLLVLDEIVLRNATTLDACEEFLARFPKHDAEVVIHGDASGRHQQTTGLTDYQVIESYFKAHSNVSTRLDVANANPSVRHRVNLVNATLRAASGEIGVLIDSKCGELIKDFEQVAYKGDSGQIDKDRDRFRTHASDALGYLICRGQKTDDTIGERQGRML